MTVSLLGSLAGTLLGTLMGFLSVFLILLVLIQRGKGGGLTGALGGPGGQSAFGSKAGDTFTVITIVVASVWGFTCAFTMWLLGSHTPSVTANTNVTAGPGDDASTTSGNELVVPPIGGDGIGGLGPLGLDDPASETATTETPSMDLSPAGGQSEPEAEASTETSPEPASGGSTESASAPSESSDSTPGSSPSPKSGPASTDSPEPAEPQPE